MCASWERLEELAVQLYDAGVVKLGDIEAKVGRRTPVYFDLRVVVTHPKVMMCAGRKRLEELAVQLFDVGVVKLGDIEAKAGRRTPIYFDLRVVVSHPKVMVAVAEQLQYLALETSHSHDLLCGVPYAALPLATVMSVNTNIPMIMRRKETKLYGTKKILEGVYKPGQNCLVVEDVVTSGGSLLETVATLREEGLSVTDAVVVLDREQGGVSVLKANGIKVRSLFSMSNLVTILRNASRINDETVEIVSDHIRKSQFTEPS